MLTAVLLCGIEWKRSAVVDRFDGGQTFNESESEQRNGSQRNQVKNEGEAIKVYIASKKRV